MDTPLSDTSSPKIEEGTREMPKKYIRTFAGDMATLKKGGTPDLEPLRPAVASAVPSVAFSEGRGEGGLQDSKPSSAPVEKPVEPPSIKPVTPTQIPSSNVGHVSFSPLSIPLSKIDLPPALNEVEGSVPAPTPVPEPVPEPAPAPEPTPIPLETYASDFSDRMKDVHASTATVLAAEQDAAPQETETKPRSSHADLVYIAIGVVLLVAGGFGAYFAYTHYPAVLAPALSAPIISAPIFVDENEQISGTGTILLSAVEKSLVRPLAPSTIRLLYTENATTTDNSIFSALQIPAPNILLRNLNASNSMTGIVNIDGTQSPFFLLSVLSYSDTFSGMLSWEPLMARDLGTLFPSFVESFGGQASSVSAIVVATTAATTTATTTSATASTSSPQATTKKVVTKTATTTVATSSAPAFIAGFRDETINNHDVRVYRDAENRSVLLYGYWNQSTLVIARDPATFAEVVLRLASARAQ